MDNEYTGSDADIAASSDAGVGSLLAHAACLTMLLAHPLVVSSRNTLSLRKSQTCKKQRENVKLMEALADRGQEPFGVFVRLHPEVRTPSGFITEAWCSVLGGPGKF